MKFQCESVEQVRRYYTVDAKNEDEARKWLRLWFESPTMVREGVVNAVLPEKTEHRKIVKVTRPKDVTEVIR